MVVGVNGVGKTTTIGAPVYQLKARVQCLGAADILEPQQLINYKFGLIE
jgi:signal recognition particle GTPase